MSREENNIIPSIKQKYILRRNPSLKSRRHGEQVAPALCKYRSAAEDVAGRMMSAYIEPTIVGNGKNLSRRRRYLDGGGIRNDSYTGTKVCVCSCGCVCIFVYVCLRVERDSHDVDRGRTSVIHRESLSPLANGSSRGGDWGPDVVGDCGKGGYRASIVDRRSCESVVRNPKGAIAFVYNAKKSAARLYVYCHRLTMRMQRNLCLGNDS